MSKSYIQLQYLNLLMRSACAWFSVKSTQVSKLYALLTHTHTHTQQYPHCRRRRRRRQWTYSPSGYICRETEKGMINSYTKWINIFTTPNRGRNSKQKKKRRTEFVYIYYLIVKRRRKMYGRCARHLRIKMT